MSSTIHLGRRAPWFVAAALIGAIGAVTLPLDAQAPPVQTAPRTVEGQLRQHILELEDQIVQLRHELADARIAAGAAERELAEVLQFMEEHDEYGDDFQRYREIRKIAEQDARRQATAKARERHLAARAERRARANAMRELREARDAEEERIDRYRRAGFASIGEEVFLGRVGFAYRVKEVGGNTWIDYEPLIGYFTRPGIPRAELDYGRMTISGSVLNAMEEIRNIGIAITFFDENGNQVGGEIVKINAARPDVPYPFTSTIDMAIDREFSSSSMYVLYADPVAP